MVKCCGCDAPVNVTYKSLEAVSSLGEKYYKAALCDTCRLLYSNLIDVISESLADGRKLIDRLHSHSS